MRSGIDMSSVLLCGLLVAAILYVAGAVPYMVPDEFGRFEIETDGGQAYVLDTATGQVWAWGPVIFDGRTITPLVPEFLAPKVDPLPSTP